MLLTKTQNTLIHIIDDVEMDLYISNYVIERNWERSIVQKFPDGLQAIDYLHQHKGLPEKLPDVILLDINMPRMNGFEFLEAFQHFPDSVLRKCKIFVLSSTFDPLEISKAQNHPSVKSFIEKPISLEKLELIKRIYNSES
ncbi:MAG: response regulator [Flavobacteriaceae bacterium]|nr:response regulator [Flavobacteriaceae bacterium]